MARERCGLMEVVVKELNAVIQMFMASIDGARKWNVRFDVTTYIPRPVHYNVPAPRAFNVGTRNTLSGLAPARDLGIA